MKDPHEDRGGALPQAVLFDWDGTLVDTIPGLRLAHNHVRTYFGHPPWTEDEFYANLRHSSRELYPHIYGADAEAALTELYRYIGESHLEHLSILPCAPELVAFLGRQAIPFAVVSNKRHDYLIKEVTHVGWHELFYFMVGAGVAARDKPAADPVLMAMAKAASPLDPARTWFVGDTETDMMAARDSGCLPVLITHGKDHAALIETYRPHVVVKDCAGLLKVLENRAFGAEGAEIKAC